MPTSHPVALGFVADHGSQIAPAAFYLSQVKRMRWVALARTTVQGSTSLVTTAPPATVAPSPTVTPGKMMQPPPSQTLLPICDQRGTENSQPDSAALLQLGYSLGYSN